MRIYTRLLHGKYRGAERLSLRAPGFLRVRERFVSLDSIPCHPISLAKKNRAGLLVLNYVERRRRGLRVRRRGRQRPSYRVSQPSLPL